MNKKYIDFVPVKLESRKEIGARRAVAHVETRVAAVRTTEVSELDVSEMFEPRRPRAGVSVKKSGVSSAADKSKMAGLSGASVPKARFVNTEKVAKRPLSKSVYPKKVVDTPKEEKLAKPVKIIDKPEKDSKVGLVVAIVITIILGAAAGTVAFLLLPK